MLLAPSARAGLDAVFFTVNGDSTLTVMTQGDEFSWAASCDVGATLNWEIWFDVNSNSVIDRSTDALLTSENFTDGDPFTEAIPILDGYTRSDAFTLSGEPGSYIFKATDIAADSSLQAILTMLPAASPPNLFSGQIILPGVSSPNSLLGGKVVFAESESGDEGAFFGVTDNTGSYSIGIGSIGSGVTFYLSPSNVAGFATPAYLTEVASGTSTGLDFSYTVAADSVWGLVKDETGSPLPFETDIGAWSFGDERYATTLNSRYVIYFDAGDPSEWSINFDSRVSPLYLDPVGIEFSFDTVSSFEQDIVVRRADTVIYARVLEDGSEPVNNYLVGAFSPLLQSGAEALSGTGSGNIVSIGISSSDMTGWDVYIIDWDYRVPIPVEFTVPDHVFGVAPGDTVTLNLSSGCCIGIRGDVNNDGNDADPVDLSYLVDNLFSGGADAVCPEEADINGDGEVADPVDLSHLVDNLFSGGPGPAACP